MKFINKQARRHVMAHCNFTMSLVRDDVARYRGYMVSSGESDRSIMNKPISPVVSNYIGNHRKHNRNIPAAKQSVGKYLTARERNRGY